MPEFVLLYRSPDGYKNSDADFDAWNTWLGGIGPDLLAGGGAVEVGALVDLPEGRGPESA